MRNNRTTDTSDTNYLGSSFRDPAGYLFIDKKGDICRQINQPGFDDYNLLMQSGLYDALVKKDLLVTHKESKASHSKTKIIKPIKIEYISYPFEWSFSQLKDAALLTIKIQKLALKHGMTLKDASAYNVQFYNGKPIFIDTLSFEKYQPGEAWQAYKQFCQHFLAPLSLMVYTDISLSQLFRVYIDGPPLDLVNKLLPLKARLKPSIYMHIVLHSKVQHAKAASATKPKRQVGQKNLEAILGNLENSVKKLQPKISQTEWGDYYNNTNYSSVAADNKADLVKSFAKSLKLESAIDFGGNNGTYSRVLNKIGIETICCDIDPNAVEANYLYVKSKKETKMLPLIVDLTNPGGALGWANDEREAIDKRFKTDLSMALALVHHLAISNNLPLNKIAQYFSNFSPYLIIEFVPKEDSQVKKLLATREDIFDNYHEEGLKKEFGLYYKLLKEQKIPGTKRSLYLFKKR